jgi:hypothetical protein
MVLEVNITIADDDDEEIHEDASIILEIDEAYCKDNKGSLVDRAELGDLYVDASRVLPEILDAIREVLKKHPEIDYTVCT